MVQVSNACLRGQHTQCWRSGLIPSRRWKYPANLVASWPSSFRFDFTNFHTEQVGMPVTEHLHVLDFLQAFNFLQEYFALGPVDEFAFIGRLQDQQQVGLNLTYWRFWAVFNVNVNNFFQITAYLLLILFRINVFPIASQQACLWILYTVDCKNLSYYYIYLRLSFLGFLWQRRLWGFLWFLD
ncbi:Hypothetical_protein [Hexamita inflata]|uniref:Hypothetical_protein n=1 Tax=Hexamita inflata TaxID=28002 RepID=A0ABP1GSM5_9EUKA